MKPIEFRYENSDVVGHKYWVTMPVPRTPELAELCSALPPDEHGNVSKGWCYGKEGWRRAVSHFEEYVQEVPISKDEIQRVMGLVLSVFDRMQSWKQSEREMYCNEPDNPNADFGPTEEEVQWMRTVYREMTETFVDVLVGAEFYEKHTLKEEHAHA